MCGIKAKQTQQLTHVFIRFVLNTLNQALTRSVSLALQMARPG